MSRCAPKSRASRASRPPLGNFARRFVRAASELVQAVEKHARARNCRIMFVATHSFQAPQFYVRMGFEQVASMVDHPVGHSSIFYAKRLDAK